MSKKESPVKHEKLIILILFFSTGAVMAMRFGITNTFAYIGDIAITPVEMGLIMSVHAIAWAVSSLVLGSLADYLHKQKLFMVGCLFLSAVLSILVGYAPNIQTVLILRALIGIFQGPLLPLLQTTARKVSSPNHIGLNQGLLIAGTGLIGQSIPAAIIPGVAQTGPSAWRSPLIVIGIIGSVTALLLGLILKTNKLENPIKQKHEENNKISAKDIGELFKTRNFILGIIGAVGSIGFTLCLSTYAAAFLANETNASTGRLSLMIAASGIMGMLSNIVLPAISDRFGRKPSYMICSIGLLLSPLVLIVFKSNMNSSLPLILYCLSFLVGGCAMSLNTYVIVGESVNPMLITTAYSICLCAGEIIGGTIGPAVAGVVANKYGLTMALVFAMAFAGLCLLASVFMKETLKETATKEQEKDVVNE